MGSVIADAMLACTAKTGAKIAFMNRGGVRSAIEPARSPRRDHLGQPFGNTLVVLDVTGQDILDMLTVGATKAGTVQVSAGFSYRSAPAASSAQ
jgi:5'-nucleotidase